MALQHLRSSTAHKRPIPTVMSAGQVAINTNEASPGLFFKDSNGDLVKVGPVHIGTSAPNSSPDSVAATALVTGTVYQILTVGTSDFTLVGASANTVGTIFTATGTTTGTGTVSGQQGNEKGEQWLDTTGGTYVLKIYDGTAWRSESGTFVDVSGDTMTGDLVMNNANIVFEGATADDFETTLTVADATADRSIVLPDVSGDIVTTGDTGTVTSTMISDGTIVNADVNGSAAIAGTKIDPDFGSQTVETTGVFSAAGGAAATPSIAFTGDLDTGIYSPGANQVAVATGGTGRLFVNDSGAQINNNLSLDILDGSGDVSLRLNNLASSQNSGRISVDPDNTGAGSKLQFDIDNSEQMVLTTTGLGIGTSLPDEKLGVAGAIRSTGVSSNFASSNGLVLDYNTTDNTGRITAARNGANSSGLRFYTYNSGSLVQNLHISPTGVGIGTTTPNYEFQVHDPSGSATIQITNGTVGSTSIDGARITSSTSGILYIENLENAATVFTTNNTERMRIGSDSAVYFQKSTSDVNTEGAYIYQGSGNTHFTTGAGDVCSFNRTVNDGTIINFLQAGTTEGTISVSGSTVTLNGAHLSRWSQLPGGAERAEILRGTVLSNLDEMCKWDDEDNEQLNRMKISDVEGDRNVSGVFQSWDDDDDTYTNDFYCAMTGDFVIRIAQGTTVVRGDLLMSAGDGTAKPQDDDIIRSKTIAKVTSTHVSETYADGSYCVPCVLMAC